MRILITGGTGLIGRALSSRLIAEGDEAIVLTRNPDHVRKIDGVQYEAWDGRTAQTWGGLINQMDAVVNLAGENIGASRWIPRRKQQILDSRIHAGMAVLEAIQATSKRPDVFVQASAIGCYGISETLSFDERSPMGDDYLSAICKQWEDSTQRVEELGVRRVIIRSGVVLDAQEGALPRMLLPFKLFVGGAIGSGRQWLSWIHLQDEVEAILFLIHSKDANGVFNLTAPEPVTNVAFGKAIAKVLQKPYWFPVPGFVLRTILGEMSTLVLDGQKVIPSRLLESGYKFLYPEVLEALREILS